MSNGIRISPRYGVNPSLMQCFYCGESSGLVLFGYIAGDREAPRIGCYDHEPCTKCADLMKQGVLLISVRDGEKGENPYRTGGWVVVKPEFIERAVGPPEFAQELIARRVAFVPNASWRMLGLPTEHLRE